MTEPDDETVAAFTVAHDLLTRAVDALEKAQDPVTRVATAGRAIDAANTVRGELARERRDAVRELRGRDRPPLRTWAEVGELIGTSGPRAQQIAELPAEPKAPRGPRRGRGDFS